MKPNPSDGSSADGLSDAWTQERGWHLSEVLWEQPEQGGVNRSKSGNDRWWKTLGGVFNYE